MRANIHLVDEKTFKSQADKDFNLPDDEKAVVIYVPLSLITPYHNEKDNINSMVDAINKLTGNHTNVSIVLVIPDALNIFNIQNSENKLVEGTIIEAISKYPSVVAQTNQQRKDWQETHKLSLQKLNHREPIKTFNDVIGKDYNQLLEFVRVIYLLSSHIQEETTVQQLLTAQKIPSLQYNEVKRLQDIFQNKDNHKILLDIHQAIEKACGGAVSTFIKKATENKTAFTTDTLTANCRSYIISELPLIMSAFNFTDANATPYMLYPMSQTNVQKSKCTELFKAAMLLTKLLNRKFPLKLLDIRFHKPKKGNQKKNHALQINITEVVQDLKNKVDSLTKKVTILENELNELKIKRHEQTDGNNNQNYVGYQNTEKLSHNMPPNNNRRERFNCCAFFYAACNKFTKFAEKLICDPCGCENRR